MSDLLHDLLGAWTLRSFVETNLDTGDRLFPLGQAPLGSRSMRLADTCLLKPHQART